MQRKSPSNVVVKIHFDLTHLDLSKILICLILFELLLIAAYGMDVALDSPSWVINKLVDLDDEGSVATWFSSIQLFIVGLLFFVKSYQVDANSTELPSRQFFWIMGLGLLFYQSTKLPQFTKKLAWYSSKPNLCLALKAVMEYGYMSMHPLQEFSVS